jgi:hypothetical protein
MRHTIHFCDCGCGDECTHKYVHGHNSRKFENRLSIQYKLDHEGPFYCKCECGEEVKEKGKFVRYHQSRCPEVQEKRVAKIQALWDDPEYYAKRSVQIKKMRGTKAARQLASERSKETWEDPDYKEMMVEYLKQAWKDPISRAKRIKSLKKAASKRWDDPAYREKMSQTMGYKNMDRGFINTIKAGRVYHRCGWERAFILILDSSSIVKSFVCEPFGIKYYKKDGSRHKHYPDFLVEFTNGDKYIFELKGPQDKDWPQKEPAARKYCDMHKYEYVVIYENPIGKSLTKYIQ